MVVIKESWRKQGIAVIGMGMRYPKGINSPLEFHRILEQGIDCITEVPKERWNSDYYYDSVETVKGTIASKQGGFIDAVDAFDPEFFQISAKEAKTMDPQQRILLELVWEALEEGGQLPSSYRGANVGVYIGSFCQDYYAMNGGCEQFDINSFSATGVTNTLLSNRISYCFDWKGPSVTLDTACSSSLVAVNLACESLLLHNCDVAVAGGVMLMLQPDYGIIETQGGFLSKEGRCRTFDASADGYVRGEGAGIIVLKRLEDALIAGDIIEGVILGSGVNQDGHTETVTEPNGESQQILMERTLKKATVTPEMVTYVEAHGTGTKIGDPVEAAAIGAVYGNCSRELLVGSVKTNIGHTESAAGIAGILKVLLMMRYQKIYAHRNLKQLNPRIAFEQQNIRIPLKTEDWTTDNKPRIAAVNSFGFGGTNAHVILMEPLKEWNAKNRGSLNEEKQQKKELSQEIFLLKLSAASEVSLNELRSKYLRSISQNMKDCSEEDSIKEREYLHDLGFSTFLTRESFEYRYAYVYHNRRELVELLSEQEIKGCQIGKAIHQQQGLVFVYSGMGPQWYGMGRELYQTSTVFREMLQHCVQIFAEYSGVDLEQELLCDPEDSHMAKVEVSQPLHVILQIALTELFSFYGIYPAIVIGHSAGEMAAFYAAGMYSLEDTLRIAYHRSRLLSRCDHMGTMLAVEISREEGMKYVRKYEGNVFLACVNGTNSITLSGEQEFLEQIKQEMSEKEIRATFLHTSIPYHSALLLPIEKELKKSLMEVQPSAGRIPVISTVTGNIIESKELDPEYWWRNVSQTVLFHEGIEALYQMGYRSFAEIGAHPVLLHEIAKHARTESKLLVPSLRRQEKEAFSIANALAKLYVNGYEFRREAWFLEGKVVSLPTYAWNHQSYWMEPEERRSRRLQQKDGVYLGRRLEVGGFLYESQISLQLFPYLSDHQVLQKTIYPAVCYIMAYLEACEQVFGVGYYELKELSFLKAIRLEGRKPIRLQTAVDLEGNQLTSYYKEKDGTYTRCACSKVRKRQTRNHQTVRLSDLCDATGQYCQRVEFYATLQKLQFQYGEQFQCVEEVWYKKDCCVARLEAKEGKASSTFPDTRSETTGKVTPQLLDACFQTLLFVDSFEKNQEFRMPVSIDTIGIWGDCTTSVWAVAYLVVRNEVATIGNIDIYDEQGAKIGEVKGFRREAVESTLNGQLNDWRYYPIWRPIPLVLRGQGEAANLIQENQFPKKTWLILSDSKEFLEEMKERLTKIGIASIIMSLTEFVEQLQEHRVLDERYELEQVIYLQKHQAITGTAMNPPSIQSLYAWSGVSEAEQYQLLLQFLMKQSSLARLWLVTEGVAAVEPEDIIENPMEAALYGIMRAYGQQENRSGYGGCIDFGVGMPVEKKASFLIDYICSNPEPLQLAVRSEQTYELMLHHDNNNRCYLTPSASDGETVLIVGAYGAIGRCIVQTMLAAGVRHFIFWTRSALDDERRAFLSKLQEKGAKVSHYTVDVSNPIEVKECIEKSTATRKLTGVIYAAGIVHDVLLEHMNAKEYEQVFDSKAIGVWNLHSYLPKDLDYFLVCSSIASYLPGIGQANYAAANCVVDAICAYRRQLGLPAVSMNWGPWSSGMVKVHELEETMRKEGFTLITPQLGGSLFWQAMQEEGSQILLTKMDSQVMLHKGGLVASLFKQERNSRQQASNENLLDQLKGLEPKEQEKRIEEKFLSLVALVRTDQNTVYDQNKSLATYGVDSLGALYLREQLIESLEVNLLIGELIGTLSIRQVLELIIERVKKNLR